MTLKSLTTYNHLFLNFEYLSYLCLFAIKKGWGNGADEETRTLNPHHGKVVLYQLSYIRLRLSSDNIISGE